MFKPYLLPKSRSLYKSPPLQNTLSSIILCATNHTMDPDNSLQHYHALNYTITDAPFFHIMTNPCVIFIFLSFYSIWLGGFTKRQIYDYLKQEQEDRL